MLKLTGPQQRTIAKFLLLADHRGKVLSFNNAKRPENAVEVWCDGKFTAIISGGGNSTILGQSITD